MLTSPAVFCAAFPSLHLSPPHDCLRSELLMTGAELNDKSEQSSAAVALLIAEWIHVQGEGGIICRIFMMCTYRLGAVVSLTICMSDLFSDKCQFQTFAFCRA